MWSSSSGPQCGGRRGSSGFAGPSYGASASPVSGLSCAKRFGPRPRTDQARPPGRSAALRCRGMDAPCRTPARRHRRRLPHRARLLRPLRARLLRARRRARDDRAAPPARLAGHGLRGHGPGDAAWRANHPRGAPSGARRRSSSSATPPAASSRAWRWRPEPFDGRRAGVADDVGCLVTLGTPYRFDPRHPRLAARRRARRRVPRPGHAGRLVRPADRVRLSRLPAGPAIAHRARACPRQRWATSSRGSPSARRRGVRVTGSWTRSARRSRGCAAPGLR